VLQELNALGYKIHSLDLGQVVLNDDIPMTIGEVEETLKKHGFEVIKDETDVMIEEIKIALINRIENHDDLNLSTALTRKFNKSYSTLSKLFSKSEGITIEKYEINLKIEKVKELIQMGQLNFSEIAYRLNYSNSGHLAKQFKNITGISMTEFKNLHKWERKSIDKIV
jgi:AraC-like DNA-binding protein